MDAQQLKVENEQLRRTVETLEALAKVLRQQKALAAPPVGSERRALLKRVK
jgi:cell division protein FtsB